MLISFLFLHKNICCGYSLEAPRWGTSNEYRQHMFSWRNKKNIMWIPPSSVAVQVDLSKQCGPRSDTAWGGLLKRICTVKHSYIDRYHNMPKIWDKHAWANSVLHNPDQMPQNAAASDQDLHCLPLIQHYILGTSTENKMDLFKFYDKYDNEFIKVSQY